MPEGRGLQQTTRPPSCDETRSVNPICIRANELSKNKKTVPTLDLFELRQGEPGTPQYIHSVL